MISRGNNVELGWYKQSIHVIYIYIYIADEYGPIDLRIIQQALETYRFQRRRRFHCSTALNIDTLPCQDNIL